MSENLPLNQIITGDCLDVLAGFPPDSIDLIFADPPYNLQLHQDLWRPDQSKVDAVDDAWDQFDDFQAYDAFTRAWLSECRRVLKPNGTLWVIGTYHNIHRVGVILQDLKFWTLNTVVWIKTNPMPNFRGVRFTNAHETLIWVQKEQGAPYTFNHHAMKSLNGDKQMRSDWVLPTCVGPERIKLDGKRAHPTQKPEALLYRVILASSNPGDIILDPFFGVGTTGAVARKLGRQYIGIEKNPQYAQLAAERLARVEPAGEDKSIFTSPNPRRLPRVAFGALLEFGYVQPGDRFTFRKRGEISAEVQADASLKYNDQRGTIHTLARILAGGPANGWELWFYEQDGERFPIDELRKRFRAEVLTNDDTNAQE